MTRSACQDPEGFGPNRRRWSIGRTSYSAPEIWEPAIAPQAALPLAFGCVRLMHIARHVGPLHLHDLTSPCVDRIGGLPAGGLSSQRTATRLERDRRVDHSPVVWTHGHSTGERQ